MCLLEWFRKEHSWDHLMRLLSQLGQDSRWAKAQFNDPDVVEDLAVKTVEGTVKAWRPQDLDWTLLHEMVGQLIDLQKQTITILANSRAKIDAFPRPETEYHRALSRLEHEKSEHDMARVYDFVAEGQRRWRQLNGVPEPEGER